MKIFGLILALLSGSGYASPPLATGALIINDPDWQPFFFAGRPHAPPGLMKEFLAQCFDENLVQYTFRHVPIERMQTEISEGLIDLNIFSYKKERESFVAFGKVPLFESTYRPFVRADSKIVIKTIADFDPLRLGHTRGLRYSQEFYEYMLRRKAQKTLDETSSDESNVRKLAANRIDIFVSTDSSVLYQAGRLGLAKQIKSLDFVIQKADYFFAIARRSPRIPDKSRLLQALDDCARRKQKDGSFCQLAQRYNHPCRY